MFGKRIGPKEALERNIVDFIGSREEIKDKVHDFAIKLPKPKSREYFQEMKLLTFAEEYKTCSERIIYPEDMEVRRLEFFEICRHRRRFCNTPAKCNESTTFMND